MDQIAALKWIQQNIKNFGGDPESVTMFGYRTGASCIHFLMQSPAAVAGHRKHQTSNLSAPAAPAAPAAPPHYCFAVQTRIDTTLLQ